MSSLSHLQTFLAAGIFERRPLGKGSTGAYLGIYVSGASLQLKRVYFNFFGRILAYLFKKSVFFIRPN